MKRILLVLPLLFFCCRADAIQLSGFENPESAIRDAETGAIYVSNVNGDPDARDGNGYISRISASGAVVIQKFIGGKPGGEALDAPKGLAIWMDRLIATDLDKVRLYNKKSGETLQTVDLGPLGASFLNDPVVDSTGTLYVSDRLANKIFSIDLNDLSKTKVLIEGAVLGGPNGLAINPRSNNLLIVTWDTGAILELDRSGRLHILKRGLKNLDGIDFDSQWNLYVSSYTQGEIYRISLLGRGALTVFASNLRTPADISCDRRKRDLLVPLMEAGVLESVPLTPHPSVPTKTS